MTILVAMMSMATYLIIRVALSHRVFSGTVSHRVFCGTVLHRVLSGTSASVGEILVMVDSGVASKVYTIIGIM